MKNEFEKFQGLEAKELEPRFKMAKEQILSPYTEEEIKAVWEVISKYRASSFPPVKNVLHRYFEGFDFAINVNHLSGKQMLEFQITNADKKNIAHIIFEQSSEQAGSWDLVHRLVDTAELGISGTEFFEQAERYLQALTDNKYIELDNITASSSQPIVINWLQKNGFEFISDSDRGVLQAYLEHPQEFEGLYFSDSPSRDTIRYNNEPFLFKKSDLDFDQLTSVLDPNIPDGKHFIMSHSQMLKIPGLMRVRLKKPMNARVAKIE